VISKVQSHTFIYYQTISLLEDQTAFNTGSWAVFENIDDAIYLRAIIDFR